jgi:hypothetical protein
MKKIALLLATITQVFTTFPAENVSFRDGTSLAADFFDKKGFEPDKDGVILTVKNKIYLHHYPVTDRSLSVPTFYFSGKNPYGISQCSPTRISFFHFETFSLLNMREKVLRMNIPVKKKVEAIRGIDRAMTFTPPEVMTSLAYKNKKQTKQWQRWAETYVAFRIAKGEVVWGKDLASLKKYNLLHRRKTLSVKRR